MKVFTALSTDALTVEEAYNDVAPAARTPVPANFKNLRRVFIININVTDNQYISRYKKRSFGFSHNHIIINQPAVIRSELWPSVSLPSLFRVPVLSRQDYFRETDHFYNYKIQQAYYQSFRGCDPSCKGYMYFHLC